MAEIVKININGEERELTIIRTNRKTTTLRLKADRTLEVRCNYFESTTEVIKFVTSKNNWISKHEALMEDRANRTQTGSNGQKAVLFGKEYHVVVLYQLPESVTINEDTITYATADSSANHINDMFYHYISLKLLDLIREYRKEFDQKICDLYEIPYPKITLKSMSSRWGSCTPSKCHISISNRLAHFPKECLYYVLAHEYCHLLEPNHSSRFYNYVEYLDPDYRKAEKMLR